MNATTHNTNALASTAIELLTTGEMDSTDRQMMASAIVCLQREIATQKPSGRPVILDGVTFHLELNSDDGSIDDVSIGVVSVKDFISDDTLKRLLAKLRAMRRDEREEAHYAECGR